jgi:hypothetical protein
MALVTEAIRGLIGATGPVQTAPAPISEDGLRRFVHAVMEGDPVHWDAGAANARYGPGGVVATPLYPGHAARRPAGTPDPLDRLADDPDWDGAGGGGGFGGLPPVELPLNRILNGGTEAEFLALARVGDVISWQARYADISEREGRSGPMVLVKVETSYTNQDGQLLARVTMTLIRR